MSLCLLLLSTLYAAQESAVASLDGRVTLDNDLSAPKIVLTLQHADSGRTETTLSDHDGAFRFEGLAPGRYSLVATGRGILSASFGSTSPNDPGRYFLLQSGESRHVSIRAVRSGGVVGHVYSQDGTPFANARVSLTSATNGTLRFGSRSDSSGQFAFDRLAPGRYVLFVQPPNDVSGGSLTSDRQYVDAVLVELSKGLDMSLHERISRLPRETRSTTVAVVANYYRDAMTAADAEPVEVTAGEIVSGIRVVLPMRPVQAVKGRLLSTKGVPASAGTVQLEEVSMNAAPAAESRGRRITTAVGADGLFEFLRVVSGHYRLTARSGENLPGSDVQTSTWYEQLVSVGDVDLDLGSLGLSAGSTVVGRVTAAREAVPLPTSVALVALPPADAARLTDLGLRRDGTTIDRDGTFLLNGLQPNAALQLVLGGLCADCWIDEVRVGGVPLAQNEPVALTAASDTSIEITVGSGTGTVVGQLASDQAMLIEASVVLLPAGQSRRGRPVVLMPLKSGLTFEFDRVRPGEYVVAAVSGSPAPSELTDAMLSELLANGIPVTVEAGKRSVVRFAIK